MAESQQGSTPSRDLDETRDDLAQASLALNTAYDRLQDLRTSLRNFTAQRDRLTSERARQVTRIPSAGTMGPDHSAIVFSDSDEESEIEMDLWRESLPARLLELTSRWGSQHARLSAARQSASPESRNDNPASLATSPSEESRPIYPPIRRRRALPPAGSSRDGGITPPGPASPARRTILEAHLRQLRHASNPAESTTTLGRRVAQRAAAAAAIQNSIAEHASQAGIVAPSDAIVHSTLPLGVEPRPYTQSLESRAANHLRYSLLPVPPPGVRPSSGSRIVGGAHPRFTDRTEHRPRTARSNSLTALPRGTPPGSSATRQASTLDLSSQSPLSSRLGQLRSTVAPLSEDDAVMRPGGHSELGDPASGSYRVRRRFNGQGEEHVFSINWNELMSDVDREDGLSDPMRSPHLPRTSRVRSGRAHALPETETDDTVVQDFAPFFSREGGEGSVQRRRGWARLNADGDEVSTEDEAALERSRAESRLPRARNWNRGHAAWGSSTVAVLDFVHRNSRDATTGHRDPHSLDRGGDTRQSEHNNSHHVINSMFRPVDASTAYPSPLPIPLPEKIVEPREYTREVQVTLNGRTAGR